MTKQRSSGGQFYGVSAIVSLIFYTILFFIPIFFVGLCKLFPNKKWQVACTKWVDTIVMAWCWRNNAYMARTQNIRWHITGMDTLDFTQDNYLVIANHQSWLDIILLQRIFHKKIPILKFFIKDQLKWVPLLGFSWWAMGSPFMKRYSKDYLLKNPHKKGTDLLATHKALEIFKAMPSTIMNFIEGTRFTPKKKALQKSPYHHLLKPKAGGISFVISVMSEKIQDILDVTIVYSNKHTLWDFLCRRIHAISIDVRRRPIPQEFIGQKLHDDAAMQIAFRSWLNDLWAEKDALIAGMQKNFGTNHDICPE